MGTFNYKIDGELVNDVGSSTKRGYIAHFEVSADDAVALDTDGVHAAITCTTINIAAACVVAAASAVTDILTVNALPVTIGADANDLSILLETAADDVLAVSADGAVITIALADTNATKNTAALIETAIQALTTVAGVDVSAFTCTAGGSWDSAAIATGETEAIDFTGGQDAESDVATDDITDPAIPRNITATSGGTEGDIGAISVVITGTNALDEVITETLPVFTANTAGTVSGSKAFKTVTSINVPAHDGTAATTAIGFGDKVGLPFLLSNDTVLRTYFNDVIESTDPTVAVSSTAIESNTILLNSTLDGSKIDCYLIVN